MPADGVTFEVIEEHGVEGFLEQIRGELIERSYVPLRARKKEIPKEGRGRRSRVLTYPHIAPPFTRTVTRGEFEK
jgi:RNA-directed DNA polymerase